MSAKSLRPNRGNINSHFQWYELLQKCKQMLNVVLKILMCFIKSGNTVFGFRGRRFRKMWILGTLLI